MSIRQNFLKEQQELEKLFNNGKSLLSKEGFAKDSATDLFVSSGLEYIDPTLHKPMSRYFALRDMPHMMVGGAMEEASFFKTNFAINTGNGSSLGSGNNGVVTTVKAQLQKKTTRIQPRQYVLEYGYIDSLKAKTIGFDFMSLFDEGVRHQYNIEKDNIAYYGLVEFSVGSNPSEGLLNASGIAKTTVSTKFENMTGEQLVSTLTGALLDTYSDIAYDSTYLPNRILVPTSLFKKLVLPLAVIGQNGSTATTGVSTLSYVKEALKASIAEENVDISILPLPYAETEGTASTGRIVIYKYGMDVVRMPIGMDLTRGATLFDPSTQSIKTNYVAFIGEPQFVRKNAIRYIDNI